MNGKPFPPALFIKKGLPVFIDLNACAGFVKISGDHFNRLKNSVFVEDFRVAEVTGQDPLQISFP